MYFILELWGSDATSNQWNQGIASHDNTIIIIIMMTSVTSVFDKKIMERNILNLNLLSISSKTVCAPSKVSHQPAHPESSLTVRLKTLWCLRSALMKCCGQTQFNV